MTIELNSNVTAEGNPPTIEERRERIRRMDEEMIRIALERTAESKEISKERAAKGDSKMVLGKEVEVIERYRTILGDEGTHIAMALLALGRGRLGR